MVTNCGGNVTTRCYSPSEQRSQQRRVIVVVMLFHGLQSAVHVKTSRQTLLCYSSYLFRLWNGNLLSEIMQWSAVMTALCCSVRINKDVLEKEFVALMLFNLYVWKEEAITFTVETEATWRGGWLVDCHPYDTDIVKLYFKCWNKTNGLGKCTKACKPVLRRACYVIIQCGTFLRCYYSQDLAHTFLKGLLVDFFSACCAKTYPSWSSSRGVGVGPCTGTCPCQM